MALDKSIVTTSMVYEALRRLWSDSFGEGQIGQLCRVCGNECEVEDAGDWAPDAHGEGCSVEAAQAILKSLGLI